MASIGEDISRDLDAFFDDPANAAETMRVARDVFGSSCDLRIQLWNETNHDAKTREGIEAFNLVMNQVRENHSLDDSLSAVSNMMREVCTEELQQGPVPICTAEELIADVVEEVAEGKAGMVAEKSGEVSDKTVMKKRKKKVAEKKRMEQQHKGEKMEKKEVSSEVEKVEKHDNAVKTTEQAETSQSSQNGNHQYNIRKTARIDYKKMGDGRNN